MCFSQFSKSDNPVQVHNICPYVTPCLNRFSLLNHISHRDKNVHVKLCTMYSLSISASTYKTYQIQILKQYSALMECNRDNPVTHHEVDLEDDLMGCPTNNFNRVSPNSGTIFMRYIKTSLLAMTHSSRQNCNIDLSITLRLVK